MKLGIFTNIEAPATDFYRTVGTYSYLEHEIKYLDIQNTKWYDIFSCDVIIAKSPNGKLYLDILRDCKRMGKKIIIDHDDNLHKTERVNPSHKALSSEASKKTVEECLSLANFVSYSTSALQDYYKEFHECPSLVIPNAWNPMLQPFMAVPKIEDKVRVLWRGSMHHLDDIATIKDEINTMADSNNFEVAMLGIQDFLMGHLFPKVHVKEWTNNLFSYFELLNNSQCHYGVFPLLKNDFNLAKSNIFAIEMLAAGGVVIAPIGIPEYNIPGVLKYDKFIDVLRIMKDRTFDRENIVKEGRQYLNDVLRIDKVNKLREQILNNLN